VSEWLRIAREPSVVKRALRTVAVVGALVAALRSR
jgi:hypothetical protein